MLRDQNISRPDPNKPIEEDRVVKAFRLCRRVAFLDESILDECVTDPLVRAQIREISAQAREALGENVAGKALLQGGVS
jgi:hypothetical protein